MTHKIAQNDDRLAILQRAVRAIILNEKTPDWIREELSAAYEQTQPEND